MAITTRLEGKAQTTVWHFDWLKKKNCWVSFLLPFFVAHTVFIVRRHFRKKRKLEKGCAKKGKRMNILRLSPFRNYFLFSRLFFCAEALRKGKEGKSEILPMSTRTSAVMVNFMVHDKAHVVCASQHWDDHGKKSRK